MSDELTDETAPARRYALNFCTTCGSRLDCEECAQPAAPDPRDAEIARLAGDRDEWRTQHENLLVMYQRAVAEVAALKTGWAEHDGVPILEREVARLNRALLAEEKAFGEMQAKLRELRKGEEG